MPPLGTFPVVLPRPDFLGVWERYLNSSHGVLIAPQWTHQQWLHSAAAVAPLVLLLDSITLPWKSGSFEFRPPLASARLHWKEQEAAAAARCLGGRTGARQAEHLLVQNMAAITEDAYQYHSEAMFAFCRLERDPCCPPRL